MLGLPVVAAMTYVARILAIDQGSNECGIAYAVGETFHHIGVIRARSGKPWAERMDYIVGELEHASASHAWAPDVVAIEDVVLYVRQDPRFGKTANVQAVLTMGETRGYLKRVIRELYPRARIIDIHPSETKAAVGAPGRRDQAKAHTLAVVAAMTGRQDLSEDEADAVAIVLAAQTKLRTEAFERLGSEASDV